ncbi:glyoxalase/bleomycin resistance protein/dioxygenase superfamily protein [Nocardia nova SH22a]|uniref:Glyoxalase/bleomycin resistance protein/dioxygenase superfamily protein n=1 Tax=Nocardia nova SH22a TaxID=1415166 RepID=W5TH58_9NOCA|nr:VOC family protein [Nocardia nova]AHH18489.1 glyoxalase/bleomycin resistance protein/dioxygenase superfamily protein [Nocardia nova SH22a]
MTLDSVFGSVHLGYVVVQSNRLSEWHRFGADAIGMHVDTPDPGVLRFRLDERACRFLIQRGPAEDVTTLGWQIDDHEAFDRVVARVSDRGVPIAEGSVEDAALRGVQRLWRFPGPKGIVQEIFTAAVTTPEPLRMPSSGWVTGEAGMGHVAIVSREPEFMRGYYETVFDSRLSDYIDENISGLKMKIRFLRVNERHHSIAIANIRGIKVDPLRTRVQHINIQSATLDDMLAAFGRVTALGFRMQWSVGQHTNDRELSFYCVTPSGFELEVGWNPIVIGPELESTWEPTTYPGISIWGHTPIGDTVLTKFAQFRRALQTVRTPEITVPQLTGGPTR